ncbi:ExbD/TolR family protein [Shimia aestuarii]|uniref:ExbD/TolR family protein n=1 Tax=Shimia aestuarii TaxID=254406 RepID=UPI001FB1AF51|nr:biopolymer transporter ExbD [Shimia aestuarii]
MILDRPAKRPMRESIVPMINVVFLLLIFFLMTAQITPPDPFDITPPESTAETPAEGQHILYISADGNLVYGDLKDDDVFAGFARLGENEPLLIRADKAVDASRIASLLPRLAAAGVRNVKLISSSR